MITVELISEYGSGGIFAYVNPGEPVRAECLLGSVIMKKILILMPLSIPFLEEHCVRASFLILQRG
jgi:hypothetical protein